MNPKNVPAGDLAKSIANIADDKNRGDKSLGSESLAIDLSGSSELGQAVIGCVDGFDGEVVQGWAYAPYSPDSSMQVRVYADAELVATGTADIFRDDLLNSGIGTGHHAFRVPMSRRIRDEKKYSVAVYVYVEDAAPILLGEMSYKLDYVIEGEITRCDGAFIMGHLISNEQIASPISVELLIDGVDCGAALASQNIDVGIAFSLRIPPEFSDGLPHVVCVRTVSPSFVIDEKVLVLRPFLTPTAALRQYSANFPQASLLDGSRQRYESLRRQLQLLIHSQESAETNIAKMRSVVTAHEQVLIGFESEDRIFGSLPSLIFPVIDKPRVSIVIPIHNKVLITYHSLASILLAPNSASFEVIVVDDGSTDESTELETVVKGVQFVRNSTPEGFIRSCNKGAALARGEYVLLLNNDTEVSAGWIDELIYVFDHFDNVGMVGAKLVYPDGTLQDAGGIVWNNGDPWLYGRGNNPNDPRFNYIRQTDYLSGACLLLRKSLWVEVKGFDERYVPAYFEDTDLAFKVRACGLKTVYTPFCQVIHFEGKSNGTDVKSGVKRFQEINRPKFKERWCEDYRNNGVYEKDVELNKDRNVRFRALVIDYSTPRPDRDAGSYAAIQEMLLLQSLGFKITFVPENLAYLGSYSEDLQRKGIETCYAPFILSVHDLLKKRGAEFDVVYVTRYAVAQNFIESIRKFAPRAKVLFNNADLHFLREIRAGIAKESRELIARSMQTRDDELSLMRKVDLVLSYTSTEEAVILSHNLDATRTARCPWVVSVPTMARGLGMRSDIAFLGNFSHHPNLEAIEYFIKDVMPVLRDSGMNIRLRIYGSNISQAVRDLAADDVIVEGWVDSVETVYESCRIFVAPLQSGAGIKGKVIGALAHGVPMVLSPVAAEGTGIRDGREAFIAATPAEWAESIGKLYDNDGLWFDMQLSARQFAASEYGFERGQKHMRHALQMVDVFSGPDDRVLFFK